MSEDYKQNHRIDPKFIWIKNDLPYIKLKGFNHIWTYFQTDKGKYVCSKYTKEKGFNVATITNTTESWRVHLFYGGAKFKSWHRYFDFLKDAEEECNLFLDGKLVLN